MSNNNSLLVAYQKKKDDPTTFILECLTKDKYNRIFNQEDKQNVMMSAVGHFFKTGLATLGALAIGHFGHEHLQKYYPKSLSNILGSKLVRYGGFPLLVLSIGMITSRLSTSRSLSAIDKKYNISFKDYERLFNESESLQTQKKHS